MRRFIIRRLIYAIPTIIGVSLITFLISRLAPGDPIRFYTFGVQDVTPEDIERIRHHFGLDLPLPLQYVNWAGQAVRGDFGDSILYHTPAFGLIVGPRLWNSLQLAALALALQLVIGVPLGVVAALNRGRWIDQVVRVFGTIFHAVPSFWFGLILIIVFAVGLRWLPSQGMLTIGKDQWDVLDRARHILLPAFVLSLTGIANYSRIMRTETLEVLNQDYVRTARAKGLLEQVVIGVHAFRNALIPMVTALGAVLAFLLSGALVIEQIFTWPGIGQFTYQSLIGKDYPVVMAGVMVSSLLLITGYLIRDITYAFVDPRVKVS